MPVVDDRQFGAFLILVILGAVIPLLTLGGLLLGTGWATVMGMHDVHGTLWGWVSKRGHDQSGQTTWAIGRTPMLYYLVIGTIYLAYQVCEGGNVLFGKFRRALS